MIKDFLRSKLGMAIMVVAVVGTVGGIATVSAAQVKPSAVAAATGYGIDQCKNGGWRNFKNPDGSPMFRSQGECVAFFARQNAEAIMVAARKFQASVLAASDKFHEDINACLSGDQQPAAATFRRSTENSLNRFRSQFAHPGDISSASDMDKQLTTATAAQTQELNQADSQLFSSAQVANQNSLRQCISTARSTFLQSIHDARDEFLATIRSIHS